MKGSASITSKDDHGKPCTATRLMTMIAYGFLQQQRLKQAQRQRRIDRGPPQPTLLARRTVALAKPDLPTMSPLPHAPQASMEIAAKVALVSAAFSDELAHISPPRPCGRVRRIVARPSKSMRRPGRPRTELRISRHIYAILRTNMDDGMAVPVAIERSRRRYLR
jgi:hypothetical protein